MVQPALIPLPTAAGLCVQKVRPSASNRSLYYSDTMLQRTNDSFYLVGPPFKLLYLPAPR